MHRTLALQIENIVKSSTFQDVKIKVYPKKTGGFWKVKLTFKERGYSHTESLIRCITELGKANGEYLFVEDNGKTVEVN